MDSPIYKNINLNNMIKNKEVTIGKLKCDDYSTQIIKIDGDDTNEIRKRMTESTNKPIIKYK